MQNSIHINIILNLSVTPIISQWFVYQLIGDQKKVKIRTFDISSLLISDNIIAIYIDTTIP